MTGSVERLQDFHMMQKLVNVVIPPINRFFTYAIDPQAQELVKVGCQVYVSFGNRQTRAFVVNELGADEISKIKEDIKIKTINPQNKIRQCFDIRDLKFFAWAADYYGESLSNIIDTAIPSPAKEKIEFTALLTDKHIEPDSLRKGAQREIYRYLKSQQAPVSLGSLKKINLRASAVLKKLQEKGLVTILEKEIIDRHISKDSAPSWTKLEIDLNKEQAEALKLIGSNIKEKISTPILLHGVTGSGKTEVYIEAIQECLKEEKGVLVLVPEIALTPQLIDRFRARLGHQIAVLHSALNRRVRWDSWRALLEKRNFVAIGARSGIFAPVPNLGLIIVDEEHDPSYKQSDGLRYNARDLAVMRAKFLGCPVVLGSATPSLESFYNATLKKYIYFSLPHRHKEKSEAGQNHATKIEVADLNAVKPWDMISKNISPLLYNALKSNIERGGQAFILYNRRGFASYLQCESCEEVLQCPHCSVTLTFHKKVNFLLCHYCNWRSKIPDYCESCRKQNDKKRSSYSLRGGGTESIFEELKKLFPQTRIDRLDRDTAGNLAAYKNILENVRNHKTQILVGTQMIAKGHDLPGVTLVGIIDCDVGLHFPDFRSAEKTYQLLTQASGRAGRGLMPGHVVMQTRVPKHHSLTMTSRQNYNGFAQRELYSRKAIGYPPFSRLLRLVVSSNNQLQAGSYLIALKKRIVQVLADESKKITILGPAPAPLEKIKDHWRWHLLIKSNSVKTLNKVVRITTAAKAKAKKIKLTIDVDPQDML